MGNSMDETTLSTLNLLESRLLRVEQLLHGQTAVSTPSQTDSAVQRMNEVEQRFATLLQHVRVYEELLRICMAWWKPPKS